jgi:hypothetical protein
MMSIKPLYLIAVAAVLGCGGPPGQPATPRMSTLLTDEEIARANADVNSAYDAIARLRPNWLAPHGPTSSNLDVSPFAVVFLDGQEYGTVSALKNLPAYYVANMRYYNPTEAGGRFGFKGGASGVIDVKSKSP